MAERFTTVRVALTIFSHGDDVLLNERQNTGYLDGWHDVPSGHVDPNESVLTTACREPLEEVGLIVCRNELELVHVYENEGYGDEPFYVGDFFLARSWQGEPQRLEPHKLGPPAFYKLNDLPPVTPQVRDALAGLATPRVTWSYYGKDEINPAGLEA